MSQVLAADSYPSNAELIVACRDLGYLRDEWYTLDPTYGRGTFWREWRPLRLSVHDIDPDKVPGGESIDFTNMGLYPDDFFDAVVFDGPYKLNGTPDGGVDERYGVHEPTRWQDRMELIRDGITECVRVLKPGGFLLVKCQDQVCSGKVRWQTRSFADHAEDLGCRLVDMLHKIGGRPQPAGRRQVHARHNYSTMLILQKDRVRW